MVDHQRIRDEHLIDRYVAGELQGEEQDLFEQHLFDCPACFEEVRVGEDFRDTLRAAAAEDVAKAAAVVSLGRAGWLARNRWALGAALVLIALLPSAFLLWRQARLESHLEQAMAAAEAARTPQPQGGAGLSEEEREVRAERDRLAAELNRERQAREELAGRITELTQLQATTLLVPLGLVREGTGEPADAADIRLGRQPGWIVLSIDPPAGPAPHRVTLLTDDGRALWRGDRVEPSLYDTLLVTVHSSLLPPGRYRARLEALPLSGRSGPAGEIPFRVLPPA
jgi:hypothetical protein